MPKQRERNSFNTYGLLALLLAISSQPAAALPVRGKQPEAVRQPIRLLPHANDIAGDVDLRESRVGDVARLIAQLTGANVLATSKAAEQTVSLFVRRTTVAELVGNLCRVAGLMHRYQPASNSYLIMTAEEFLRDTEVYRPDGVRVLTLRHHNVVSAANVLKAAFGNRVKLSEPVEEGLGEKLEVSEQLRRQGAGKTARDASRSEASGQTPPAAAGQGQTVEARAARLALQEGESLTSTGRDALVKGEEAPIYVTYNKQHNLLVIRTGDENAMTEISRLIANIDKPARQVLLEMKIVEVELGDSFESAFDFSMTSGDNQTAIEDGKPANPFVSGAAAAPALIGQLGNVTVNSGNQALFQLMNKHIRARMQLLESQRKLNTLAKPMLLASNNEPARLFLGERVVLTTGARSNTTTGTTGASSTTVTLDTEVRNIGNTLVIHPRINADRTVTLTIDQENSRRVVGGQTIPIGAGSGVMNVPIDTLNTSNLQVAALARDGYTIAIGGMVREDRNDAQSKVPGLADIPLLGALFRQDARAYKRKEMVLLITPHVLDDAEQAQAVSAQKTGAAFRQESLKPQPAADDAPSQSPPAH